jgi:HSP20 family protein
MTLGDLVPWSRKDNNLALGARDRNIGSTELSPFMRLHQEMNRLFDDVFRSFDAPTAWSAGWPHLEVHETEDAYRVTAELPGLEEKDVELSFQDGVLTLRGEKREETRNAGSTVSERYYGRFERRIALGDIDESKANATFDKGVLTITLPKAPDARERVKRIPINASGAVH